MAATNTPTAATTTIENKTTWHSTNVRLKQRQGNAVKDELLNLEEEESALELLEKESIKEKKEEEEDDISS
eukprot:10923035-Ditylum_brightwellii.AAC.1